MPSSPSIVSSSSHQESDIEKHPSPSTSKPTSVSEADDAASLATSESERTAEKRFLRRLDVCLLTWAWLAYIIKQLDASNYKTAYASGMKEALGLYGNELNYLDTFYRIGYALFLIPSQIILLKIRPSIWLPALEVCWGVLTGLMAVASNVKGMYALRFFIGVCEASSYPGIICILCNWYTPAELASRIAIFGTSYPAANIFVSFMQAALYKGLEGHGGLPGWKWLFILNAIMTVFVAAGGFFLLPDNPGETKVFWLSPEQNSLSRARMVRVKKLAPTVLSLAKIKKIFSSWILYAFTLAYACWSWSQNSNSYTILFFKSIKSSSGSARFSVPTLNAIMIPGYFLQIIVMLACGWASGKWGSRIAWVVGQEATLLVGAVILSCWPSSFGLKTFAYFTLWLSNAAGPILIAWMADICPSPEERSIIIGVSVTFVFIIDAWANILVYPTVSAPNYPAGFKVAAGFANATRPARRGSEGTDLRASSRPNSPLPSSPGTCLILACLPSEQPHQSALASIISSTLPNASGSPIRSSYQIT